MDTHLMAVVAEGSRRRVYLPPSHEQVTAAALAGLAIAPFGREVREKEPPGGCVSIVMNIIWIILPGLELALIHLMLALVFAITIVGLPIAAQHLKMTRLALIPVAWGMKRADTMLKARAGPSPG